MTVSLGKYLIKALSTKIVKVISLIIAWAFACFTKSGLRKSVVLCLLVVILQMVQLIVIVVK